MPNRTHIHTTQYAQEHYLYGSTPVEWPTASLCEFHGVSRLGSHNRQVAVATLTDHKTPVATSGTITHWQPTVRSYTDYYPFGMEMAERSFSSSSYRFGYNTQEKVEEIAGEGNHYTALFWDYSPRAVQRWNIDPKPNQSFSPYAINQCNPIWFSDPFGDTVKYKTQADRELVERYTTQTITKTNLIGKEVERRNKLYNAEFANIITDLDSREEVYEIGQGTFSGGKFGEFRYTGEKFEILYSTPDVSFGGGVGAVLFEEVFHARQFTQGKFTFEKTGKQWGGVGVDATDELEAKRFALNAGYNATFLNNGYHITTQLGFIATLAKADAIDYLVQGRAEQATKNIGGNAFMTTTFTHNPAYPNLGKREINSSLTNRTFNSNVVGYPLQR